MLCILYVIAVGTCLGLAGALVEYVLPPTWARRWVWGAVLAISFVLPGVYRMHHAWTFTEGHAIQPAAGHVELGTRIMSPYVERQLPVDEALRTMDTL